MDQGIWPFNPELVLETLREQCFPTGPEFRIYDGKSTLPPHPLSSVSPPTTVDQLQVSINKAQKTMDKMTDEVHNIMDDHLRDRLHWIFTGGLIYAQLAAQHQHEIKQLQANQRHTR